MSYQYLKYNPENNRRYMEIIYLTKYLYPVKGLISRIILMTLEFSFYRVRSVQVIIVKKYYDKGLCV